MSDVSNTSEPEAEAWSTDWQRLPPAAGFVRSLSGALTGAVAGVALAGAGMAVVDSLAGQVILAAVSVPAGAGFGAWVGRARWRRTWWRLDDQGLRVRRGYLWRVELLVPRSRVQHLDIERGPLERRFGLATLVVHTAGSQTSALRQPGLADADAVRLRDALIPETRGGDAL